MGLSLVEKRALLESRWEPYVAFAGDGHVVALGSQMCDLVVQRLPEFPRPSRLLQQVRYTGWLSSPERPKLDSRDGAGGRHPKRPGKQSLQNDQNTNSSFFKERVIRVSSGAFDLRCRLRVFN